MLMILCAIVVSFCAAGMILWYGEGKGSIFLLFIGVLLFIVTGISSISYSFTAWGWLASEHKMHIVNREYGTSYSREEIFYASDVIDTIRELDRKRFEVNGNIMRGGDK
jgi:hypothetical protein